MPLSCINALDLRALKTEYEIMKLAIFSFLILIVSTTFGQNPTMGYFVNEVGMAAEGSSIEVDVNGDTILVSDYSGNNLSLNTPSKLVKKYKGTPYFRNKWFQGTVTLDGSEPSEGLIGFNVVKGVIYYSPDKNTQAIELTPPKFALDGLVFRQFDDEISGANKYYYNVVVDGEPILLRQHTGKYTSITDKVDAAYGNSSNTEFVGKFEKYEDYYFVVQKSLVLVKPKKSFVKSLGPYEGRAKELIAKHKLNLKKGSDIVQLAKLLNQ